ncbi:MAG: hypothetical protein E7624_00485 [Ruminococcaceae bacterium]|nr:hypothetical protein [Oscillospiraceae bacterium]
MSKASKQPLALPPATETTPTQKEPKKTGYWSHPADAYTLAFRVLLIALPLFVIVFMAIGAQAFTQNSIYSFGMDLRSVSSFLSSDYRDVFYTYEEGERVACAYRDGVAVVSSGGVEIYSPDGERLLDVPMTLTSPRAASSQKYLIAYDFATTSFTVTNAYKVLFEGKTAFPILAVCAADTGHFAVVTTSDTHLSQILLYDANFNLIQRFMRGSATTDVAISENGKYVACSGISTENGIAKSVVECYRIGDEQPLYSVACEELALRISFTDHRHLAVLGNNSLRVLDPDGDVRGEIGFGAGVPLSFEVSEAGVLLLLEEDALHGNNRIVFLDADGDTVYDAAWQGKVERATFSGEYVFLLCDAQIVRLHLGDQTSSTVACEPGATSFWSVSKSALRVAYDAKAIYVEFE